MIRVIHRRCSRTISDTMEMFSPVCTISYPHPVIRQQNKSDLFFIHDLIRQPQGMLFHVKSLHFLYALHKALYHRHDAVNTSPGHRQDTTITPPTHRRY